VNNADKLAGRDTPAFDKHRRLLLDQSEASLNDRSLDKAGLDNSEGLMESKDSSYFNISDDNRYGQGSVALKLKNSLN